MSAPDPVRIGIVDDEPLARRRLERLVGLHPQGQCVGSWSSATEALEALLTIEADVLLLDIDLGKLSGLDLAGTLKQRAAVQTSIPKIIFVTAHRDHALRAFELGAIDYLLKPVSAERVAEALQRVGLPGPAGAAESPQGARLAVPTRNGIVMIAQSGVVGASYDELLELHLVDATSVWVDWTLARLEEALGEHDFIRVGRSHALRPSAVQNLRVLENGTAEAQLTGNVMVPVSRRALRRLREVL